MIDAWGVFGEIVLRNVTSLDITTNKSTLIKVMAWHLAITWASVYPNLCHHIGSLGHNESTIGSL